MKEVRPNAFKWMAKKTFYCTVFLYFLYFYSVPIGCKLLVEKQFFGSGCCGLVVALFKSAPLWIFIQKALKRFLKITAIEKQSLMI